jgi:predicted dehydrogenase
MTASKPDAQVSAIMGNDIRLAILGCGAVTELGHLPAISRLRNARATLLVDTNAERRERLAAAFNVEHTASSVDACLDLFDAAVVALPHALHASACIQLLARGKSVLVEKPMALTTAECDAMIEAAANSGAVLAVGLVRRSLWSLQLARSIVDGGLLGRVESFDFREGNIYNWPVASDFFFRRDAAGGGVLVDTGAHTLDCLLYLLGDFAEAEYFDDAEGGVDANCLINLRLKNGIPGVVELSRTRRLRNTGIVRGERGSLELALLGNQLKLSVENAPYVLSGSARTAKDPTQDQTSELLTSQLENFIEAIQSGRLPVADGAAGKSSVRLIEACYRNRAPLVLPWAQ